MPVKHLQVPRYISFLNNFDLNGEAGWYRGYFTPSLLWDGVFLRLQGRKFFGRNLAIIR